MGQTELRAPGEDRALVAHDDEVRDLALQQVVGRLDDAVLFAFGQHDRFLVRLGAAEQAVLEGVRGDREVDLDVDGPQDLFGWHVRLEGGERRIGLRRLGERDLGDRPHRQPEVRERVLDRDGVARLAARHEDSQHLVAGGLHAFDGETDGVLELVRPTVDGAHGEEDAGLQVGGDVRVELVGGWVVDVRLVGADDERRVRAGHVRRVVERRDDVAAGAFLVLAHLVNVQSGGQRDAEAGVGGVQQDGGEVVVIGDRGAEHGGLEFGGQRLEHAVCHDVASVCAFRTCDVDVRCCHVCLLVGDGTARVTALFHTY